MSTKAHLRSQVHVSHLDAQAHRAWARLRFSIIGQLLSSPPDAGELCTRIAELAALTWNHPTSGQPVRFSAKTIERWYYQARKEIDPVQALERKIPSHAGTHPSILAVLAQALRVQYRQHLSWSYKLHYDNLQALARADSTLGHVPAYATLCRFMQHNGLRRFPRRACTNPEAERNACDKGAPQAGAGERREQRSYEVEHVLAVWHTDFHHGSHKILTADGTWRTPVVLAFIDDHSRLCCHVQWYFDETAENFIHGVCQAFAKRGLPRQIFSDNGAPMVAAETTEGLERLSVTYDTTLPSHPEQNAKVECFWAQLEGRLMAMLEGKPDLTLGLLNIATQAWAEVEYNHHHHEEIGCSPLQRFLVGKSVGRPCPNSETMRHAFRMQVVRTQRHSDGTATYAGVRYEVPATYAHLNKLTLRVARWDLSAIELVDERRGTYLATLLPLDKNKNANRHRRVIPVTAEPPLPSAGIAPRLREIMAEYAATGLPPAYLPKDESQCAETGATRGAS
jgi:transposase InsO family protein